MRNCIFVVANSDKLSLCILGNFAYFLSSAEFFFKFNLKKKIFQE